MAAIQLYATLLAIKGRICNIRLYFMFGRRFCISYRLVTKPIGIDNTVENIIFGPTLVSFHSFIDGKEVVAQMISAGIL